MIADGTDDRGAYMIFEWVDGTDLEEVFSNCRNHQEALSLKPALVVFHHLVQGLMYLHQLQDASGAGLKLIHRDLSPGNVLLSNTGELKIADFGIAKSEIKDTKTVAGELKGKFAYMAPEQTRGDPMDQRVDLFALGIVMWEGLTGKPLFDANNNLDVVQRVRNRQAPALKSIRDDVPESLSDLVAQLLEKDPNQRPDTAQKVMEQLETVLATEGLFDGHKRVLARLAQSNPRTAHFRHVPSGGATIKTDVPQPKAVVKHVAQEGVTTELVRENQKPRIGLSVVLLLAVLLGGGSMAVSWFLKEPPKVAPPTNGAAGDGLVPPKTAVPEPPPPKPVPAPAPPKPAPTKPPNKQRPKKITSGAVASGFGRLSLASAPWGWVEIDGQKLEKHTPIKDLRLPTGPHSVRVYNPELKLERAFKVTIGKDQTVFKKINLTTGQIR